MAKKKKNKRQKKTGRWLNGIGLVLLLLVIAVCVPLTVPRILGYQVYHVISGSMAPAIPTGSLVYVKSTPAAEIQKEDVIACDQWKYGACDSDRKSGVCKKYTGCGDSEGRCDRVLQCG